ncbi:MAG: hypothetical protein H7259_07905, partial [Cytophagales bacterium]|nr:hypothetical protein [Cytophaga sp.]
MNKMRHSFFLLAYLLSNGIVLAQGTYPVFFLQNQLTGLSYNPGFAGMTSNPRISAATSVVKNFNNYYASYDQYSSKLRSGIGVLA